jgi:hypothetical protein
MGKSFILPDPGFRPHIILPPEHARWLTSQPEDVLSSERIRQERFGLRYLLPPEPDIHIPSVLHYERVQEAFVDKMLRTVDVTLGIDKKNWKSVNLFLALEKIIYRSASVVTIGSELADHEEFQKAFSGMAMWLGTGIVVVGELTPWPFKVLAGYVFRVPITLYLRRCTKLVSRVFEQDAEKHQAGRGDKSEGTAIDLITILAHQSLGKKNQHDSKAIARHLVIAVRPRSVSRNEQGKKLIQLWSSSPPQCRHASPPQRTCWSISLAAILVCNICRPFEKKPSQ